MDISSGNHQSFIYIEKGKGRANPRSPEYTFNTWSISARGTKFSWRSAGDSATGEAGLATRFHLDLSVIH